MVLSPGIFENPLKIKVTVDTSELDAALAKAEKLVEPGEIAPEDVMTLFVLVDYIVVGGNN